ncbi:MAG: hypothetical protein SFX18_01750 [Pirellulales bacterium]|nr:hypothetical protein [Pirellulales bacterium]
MEPTSLSAADIAFADQLRQLRPGGDIRVNSPAVISSAISSPAVSAPQSASAITDVRANVLFQAGWCAALAAIERNHSPLLAGSSLPTAVNGHSTPLVSTTIPTAVTATQSPSSPSARMPLAWMATCAALLLACTGLLVLQVWQIQTGQLAFGKVRPADHDTRPLLGNSPGSPRVSPSLVPGNVAVRGMTDKDLSVAATPQSPSVDLQAPILVPLTTGQFGWLGQLSVIWGGWLGPPTPHINIRSAQDVARQPNYWQVRHNLHLPDLGRTFSGSNIYTGSSGTQGQQDLLWQEVEADLRQL